MPQGTVREDLVGGVHELKAVKRDQKAQGGNGVGVWAVVFRPNDFGRLEQAVRQQNCAHLPDNYPGTLFRVDSERAISRTRPQ